MFSVSDRNDVRTRSLVGAKNGISGGLCPLENLPCNVMLDIRPLIG